VHAICTVHGCTTADCSSCNGHARQVGPAGLHFPAGSYFLANVSFPLWYLFSFFQQYEISILPSKSTCSLPARTRARALSLFSPRPRPRLNCTEQCQRTTKHITTTNSSWLHLPAQVPMQTNDHPLSAPHSATAPSTVPSPSFSVVCCVRNS
jgi:hypothetical protein